MFIVGVEMGLHPNWT